MNALCILFRDVGSKRIIYAEPKLPQDEMLNWIKVLSSVINVIIPNFYSFINSGFSVNSVSILFLNRINNFLPLIFLSIFL